MAAILVDETKCTRLVTPHRVICSGQKARWFAGKTAAGAPEHVDECESMGGFVYTMECVCALLFSTAVVPKDEGQRRLCTQNMLEKTSL